MDPVSEVLAERERKPARLAPFALIAVLLHAGIAATAFLAARVGSSRPALLPAVSVRLVRPSPAASSRPRGASATPVPVPTRAVPTAVPSAAPVATPIAAATRPPRPDAPSADAMPDARGAATPAAPPTAGSVGSEARASGLAVGAGDGSANPGIPSDFQFTYYVERMLALIESRWYKPPAPQGTRARARFQIARDGRLDGIVLEDSSGDPTFDRAVLRALYAANPLPPLPPAYRKDSLTVHLSFSE